LAVSIQNFIVIRQQQLFNPWAAFLFFDLSFRIAILRGLKAHGSQHYFWSVFSMLERNGDVRGLDITFRKWEFGVFNAESRRIRERRENAVLRTAPTGEGARRHILKCVEGGGIPPPCGGYGEGFG